MIYTRYAVIKKINPWSVFIRHHCRRARGRLIYCDTQQISDRVYVSRTAQ